MKSLRSFISRCLALNHRT